jgi:hypothetical protein
MVAWSGGRAVLITVLIWPLCHRCAAAWDQAGWQQRRGWRWGFAVLFLFPELLVGYGYARHVAGRFWWAEAVCAGLLALRLIPLGTWALLVAPCPSVSRSAVHVRQTVMRTWADWWLWWTCVRRAYIDWQLPAFALVLLVAFQQFELAALLKAVSWTDGVFVAQAAGASFFDSVRLASTAVIAQLILVAVILWPLSQPAQADRSGAFAEHGDATGHSIHGVAAKWSTDAASSKTLVMVLLLGAGLVAVVYPAWQLMRDWPIGFWQFVQQPVRLTRLLSDVVAAWLVSSLAAAAAMSLVAICQGWFRRGLLLACLPGLCGSLLVGLGLQASFQQPVLARWYDTVLPWWCGLTLWLLPRAALWQVAMRGSRSAIHQAELLTASDDARQQTIARGLLWRIRDSGPWMGFCLCSYWGYQELMLADLLAPSSINSGVVRLYNFMHFGRTAALSAEATVLLGVPIMLILATKLVWQRWSWQWHRRRRSALLKNSSPLPATSSAST